MPRQHWSHIWIPLIGSFTWFATLTAMLITWLAQGRPRFVTQDTDFPFISDIGADILKPLFIAGCVITGVSFPLSLLVERLFRNAGRLPQGIRKRERVLSYIAILAALVSGFGLGFLAVFDTKNHQKLHAVGFAIHLGGLTFSVIFTVLEFGWLSRDNPEFRKLKRSYIVKFIVGSLVVGLSFAFVFNNTRTIGAAFEWFSAYALALYIFTFYFDLRMSKEVKGHTPGQFTTKRENVNVRLKAAAGAGAVPHPPRPSHGYKPAGNTARGGRHFYPPQDKYEHRPLIR